MTAEPSGAGVPGAMLWISWHAPLLTSATSRCTWGATERRVASTSAQLAGVGSVLAGLILSQLTSPRLSTVSRTSAREFPS